MANFIAEYEFNPKLASSRPFTTEALLPEQVKEALKKDFTQYLQVGAILTVGDKVLCLEDKTVYSFHQGDRP